ncbi:protein artemis [Monomorium pharaonis]|uniref:protein artemis n=1 Tax=Monomorium pharaonis TaxID=307658 RepID=UPI00063F08AF|nr:protein artemis [Monomorium pharaonis]
MSTFLGLIEEIPGISVDRFDGKNLYSSAYFLSHCHTDHMRGLNQQFFEHLKQYKKYLYCSRISKVFLETKYNIETCVKDIDIDNKISIEYKSQGSKTNLFVTCISAGHCPGSVMFLFEKMDKLILYTGDFRINPRDYKKIVSLHYCRDFNVLPKKFAKMYLDTTFLDPNFTFLPTRKESINEMCKVVRKWLEESPRNVVVLECSALYGSEFLYMELSKSLHIPIHIKNHVYESYCRIPDLARHITNNSLTTRIHACMEKMDRSGLECRSDIDNKNILTIVPSVQKWKGSDTSVVGEWDRDRERTFNVCYSTHASFDELKKFIQYFKPQEIHPCVCPESLKYTIFRLLNEIKSTF